MVASLPNKGAKPLIWLARAARTCWEESCERSRTQGTIRARMTSFSKSFESPRDKHLIMAGERKGGKTSTWNLR